MNIGEIMVNVIRYTPLAQALFDQVKTGEIMEDTEPEVKVRLTLGVLEKIVVVKAGHWNTKTDNELNDAIRYQISQKKKELVRDGLSLIFGGQWREYERETNEHNTR
jgi:hypothetical protein